MIIKFSIKFEISREKPSPLSTRESWRRLKTLVRTRDKGTCQYCGELAQDGQPDHVVPLSQGGSDTMSNLIWSCKICNSTKQGKTPEEWEEWLDSANLNNCEPPDSQEEEIEDDLLQDTPDAILKTAIDILETPGWVDEWIHGGNFVYGWQTEIGRQLGVPNAGGGRRKILRVSDEIMNLLTSSTHKEETLSPKLVESDGVIQ